MKKIYMFLFIILSGLFLWGCDNKDGDFYEDEDGNRVRIKELSFVHIWPEHSSTISKIVNDYMAENKGIRINIQVSSFSDIPQYLNTQLLGGTMPDIYFYWTNQVSGYARNNGALDLTPYIEDWKENYINDGEAWELAKIDNKYYSVPFRVTGNVIVYNKTMFDYQGIDEVPTSIQEFEDALVKLRNFSNNQAFSPFAVTGVSGGTLVQLYTAFQNFVGLQQEIYKDPNYKTGLLAPDDSTYNVESMIMDKLKSWNDKKYFGNSDGKSEITAIRNFVEGNAAMVLMNNNNLYLLDDMDDEIEIGFMALPAPSGIDYTFIYSDYDGFSISKNTRYPKEAVDFLKHLTSLEIQQSFANETKSIMTVKDINYDDLEQTKMAYAMRDAGNSLLSRPDIQYSTSDIDQDNVKMLLDYILGKSKISSLQTAKNIHENYRRVIQDAQLNYIDVSIEIKDPDLSWLEIR